ncbi:response regulator [Methylobacterium sp. ID0610]|uniref:response regulator n=1 Tax=Methylobacterium carpenticola TaxID=3344827 RepID=UPI0036A740FC
MAGALAGRRILVVEDDYFIADEIRADFEAAGTTVIGPVPTVAEALALIERTPDLDGVVLDINLRGEMGYPVADAIIARSVPLVFVTGYDAGRIPVRYRHVTCCDKPIEVRQIARALFG